MFPNHSQMKPQAASPMPPKGKGKKKSKGKKPPPFKKGGIMGGALGKALLGK